MGRKIFALVISAGVGLALAGHLSSKDIGHQPLMPLEDCERDGSASLSACLRSYMGDETVIAAHWRDHVDIEVTRRPVTAALSKREYLRDVQYYAPRLLDYFKDAERISFTLFAKMTSIQGQDVVVRAISTTISRKTSAKTNWQAVDIENIPAFADAYWQAPAFR